MNEHRRCVGVFGGTFDPIHYGHLRTALELLNQIGLAQVRFVPSREPPHRAPPLMSPELRLRMVKAAIQSEPRFVADAREMERQGFSYSVDTLAGLRKEMPDTPLGMIVGMDAFLGLPQWHDWRRIFELAHVIVARRPGWQAPSEGALAALLDTLRVHNAEELHTTPAGRIYLASVTQLEISSTDLRNSIAAGIDPMYLVPPAVRAIIIETESYAKQERTVA